MTPPIRAFPNVATSVVDSALDVPDQPSEVLQMAVRALADFVTVVLPGVVGIDQEPFSFFNSHKAPSFGVVDTATFCVVPCVMEAQADRAIINAQREINLSMGTLERWLMFSTRITLPDISNMTDWLTGVANGCTGGVNLNLICWIWLKKRRRERSADRCPAWPVVVGLGRGLDAPARPDRLEAKAWDYSPKRRHIP